MRILALETTDRIGSVAALDGANPLLEMALDESQRSAQSLAPAVQALLARAAWQPADVSLVAVSIGPGSFTGLRVGVTFAKVFAYSVGATTLGINTLEAIAAAAPEDVSQLTAVMDAQRGDLVVQSFTRQPDRWLKTTTTPLLLAAEEWIASLPAGAVVAGPGLSKWASRLPTHVRVLDQQLWTPRAALVGQLADRYHREGRRDDLWKLVPHYSRRSAAEERWDSRQAPAPKA